MFGIFVSYYYSSSGFVCTFMCFRAKNWATPLAALGVYTKVSYLQKGIKHSCIDVARICACVMFYFPKFCGTHVSFRHLLCYVYNFGEINRS